ncbi:hypothetical protein CDD82_1738 [Ophiocordyceps australis]|uniref:IMD domain-containing protein n=1 Tax=Ophiocordyceps australis TaxID=1399860 RepID=A0A2C5XXM9_9HYPO|nr:hypothetical protein CDD82_1738 [Ophiocordyceps australis]
MLHTSQLPAGPPPTARVGHVTARAFCGNTSMLVLSKPWKAAQSSSLILLHPSPPPLSSSATAMTSPHIPPGSPTLSQLPPVPSSPVYSLLSTSTTRPVSHFNLAIPLPPPPPPPPAHAILTKADLARSQDAYAELLASAKTYRRALATLSTAASAFACALEACARLNEARAHPVGPSVAASAAVPAAAAAATPSLSSPNGPSPAARAAPTADTLLAAAGLHHLVANHQQILSETVYRSFEVPLLHDLDRWHAIMDDEDDLYRRSVRAQAAEVKRLEREGLKLHRQRRRDIARLRAHLVDLTAKLDGLTVLHSDHARTRLRESQETSARILDASCSLVRAEVDIYEGLARKGWAGGGLDDLLDKGQDLFAAAADDSAPGALTTSISTAASTAGDASKLFSILPPRSILADSAPTDASSRLGHTRGDSLLSDPTHHTPPSSHLPHHLLQNHSYSPAPFLSADAESVASADFVRPRHARPFSPQPIRRIPADVTFDSLGATVADALDPPHPQHHDASRHNATLDTASDAHHDTSPATAHGPGSSDADTCAVPATDANNDAPDRQGLRASLFDLDQQEQHRGRRPQSSCSSTPRASSPQSQSSPILNTHITFAYDEDESE